MRIHGYFNKDFGPDAPFIDIRVVSQPIGLNRKVKMHMDLGGIYYTDLDLYVIIIRMNYISKNELNESLLFIGSS